MKKAQVFNALNNYNWLGVGVGNNCLDEHQNNEYAAVLVQNLSLHHHLQQSFQHISMIWKNNLVLPKFLAKQDSKSYYKAQNNSKSST